MIERHALLPGPAVCVCVSVHVPRVHRFHVHHVQPRSWGGGDDPSNLVWLCPSGHYNVHALLNHYVRAMGEPSWELRRGFSPYTRGLAERAWVAWVESTLADTRPPYTLGERTWPPLVGLEECWLAA